MHVCITSNLLTIEGMSPTQEFAVGSHDSLFNFVIVRRPQVDRTANRKAIHNFSNYSFFNFAVERWDQMRWKTNQKVIQDY